MPTKRKWTVWEMPKRRCSRSGEFHQTVDSHAGCAYDSQKDYHGTWSTAYEEANASGEAIDWNAWIEYGNSNYWHFNPCKHVVKRISRSGGGQVFLSKVVNTAGLEECYWHEYEEDLVHISRSDFITLQPNLLDWAGPFDLGKLESFEWLNSPEFATKLRVLDRIALDTMIPQLDAGIDLPVFIGEILELKVLWKQFKAASSIFGRGGYGSLIESLQQIKKAPLRELSSSWLAFIFGWMPFVKDVMRICTGLWNMFEKIDSWADGANERKTLHFEKNLSPLTFKEPAWFTLSDYTVEFSAENHYEDWWFAKDAFKCIRLATEGRRVIDDPKFHATLEFCYRVPALQSGRNFWIAWLGMCAKYWRIKKFSPAQAWELIPFSFVVDWFLSVGPWLEQFDKDWLDIQVIIYDYCHSFDYRQRTTLQVKPDVVYFVEPYQSSDSSPYWKCLPQSTTQHQNVECYWREALRSGPLPDPSQLPNGRTPKGLQWVTAGALLGQLGSRRRR